MWRWGARGPHHHVLHRFDEELASFLGWSRNWTEIVSTTTPDGLIAAHHAIMTGRSRPETATLQTLDN